MEQATDEKIQAVDEEDKKQREANHPFFGKGGGYQLLDLDLFNPERHKTASGSKSQSRVPAERRVASKWVLRRPAILFVLLGEFPMDSGQETPEPSE
jgi:hypothetical protein